MCQILSVKQSLEKRGSTALVILQLLELLEVAVHCSTSRFFDQQKQMAGHQVFEDDGVVVVVVCLSFFFLSFVSCFKGSQQLALILPKNVKWPSSRDAKQKNRNGWFTWHSPNRRNRSIGWAGFVRLATPGYSLLHAHLLWTPAFVQLVFFTRKGKCRPLIVSMNSFWRGNSFFLVGDEDLEQSLNTYSKEDCSEAIYIFCVAKWKWPCMINHL